MDLPSLSLNLSGTHVLITGTAGYIGAATVPFFLSAGSLVTAIDIKAQSFPPHPNLLTLQADISSEESITTAFGKAYDKHGVIAVCIALASLDYSVLPHHASLTTMSLSQWEHTFSVNVTGTFLTAKTWLRNIEAHATPNTKNVSLIIVGSESGQYGERGNADYSAGKSAVQYGLMRALAPDVARIHPNGRVNAIAPGPVDTPQFRREVEGDPKQLWLDAEAT